MPETSFYFHARLNDFLPKADRGLVIKCVFNGNPTTKHLIEALGIPHPEIGRIVANQVKVDFHHQVQAGESIVVFPVSPRWNDPNGLFKDGNLAIPPRFVLDNHLGRLAAYLRMLGFDTQYHNSFEDSQLVQIAAMDTRILLTRDRQLLMHKIIHYGYCIRSLDPKEQLVEILVHFNLADSVYPFQRCLLCNQPLEPVSKGVIMDRLEPLTNRYYNEFKLCPSCNQVYWKGSHFERMSHLVEEALLDAQAQLNELEINGQKD